MTPPEFKLVPLTAGHSAATFRWINHPALMPPLNRLHIISPSEHVAWFPSLAERRDVAYFAIEVGDSREHAGNIWLHAIDPVHRKAEVRVMLSPDLSFPGLGSSAIGKLAEMAFDSMRLHRLTACVLATNPRAVRAFEKAGFSVEGTLRSDRWTGTGFVDVLLLARISRA
jgi:hypothetical protein